MTHRDGSATNDEGYLLLGLVVVCFMLLLFLSIAAPRMAKELEHDREVESEHRAQEYVRAIQLYYRRTQRFPSSVDQLLGSGTTGISSAANVKYLRQQYKDPLTRDDYRLILVGQAKTEVKGFFGEPLQGAPVGNLGSVAGMQSNPGGTGASAIGGSTPGTAAGSSSGFTLGGGSFGAGSATAATGSASSAAGSVPSAGGTSSAGNASAPGGVAGPGTGSSSGSGSDATTFQGSKGAFLGVGSNAKGHGQVEWNGSENIEDWEFLYDPRVELLKAKVSLFGGTPAASGNGSLGAPPGAGPTSIFGPSGTGTTTTGPTNPNGTPLPGAPSTTFSPAGTPTNGAPAVPQP